MMLPQNAVILSVILLLSATPCSTSSENSVSQERFFIMCSLQRQNSSAVKIANDTGTALTFITTFDAKIYLKLDLIVHKPDMY